MACPEQPLFVLGPATPNDTRIVDNSGSHFVSVTHTESEALLSSLRLTFWWSRQVLLQSQRGVLSNLAELQKVREHV